MHRTLAAALLATLVDTATAQAQPVTPSIPNVDYGDGHIRQKLDVYLPADHTTGPARPVLVFIHGGGWQNGDKSTTTAKMTQFTRLGFVGVTINYRLSGDATHPAQIHDCKAAIRWVKANAAALNADPERVGVWGTSAGGHLVALVGASGDVPSLEGAVGPNDALSSNVHAVADWFGPADFLWITGGHAQCNSPESRMLGVCLQDLIDNPTDPSLDDERAHVASASPVTHASPVDPPFLMQHGTADPVVHPEHSTLLKQALDVAGVPNALRYIQGAGHGLPQSEELYVRRFMVETLDAPVCPGDFNLDGEWGLGDLVSFLQLWQPAIGTSAVEPSLIDLNKDGFIDLADLVSFVEDWQPGC